jgi:hypothetical protein
MSLNSIEEIKEFLTTIKCGEPIFTINTGYSDSISLVLEDWVEKDALRNSSDTILSFIGNSIDRSYSIEDKSLKVDIEKVLPKLGDYIYHAAVDMARETSTSDQPKRTLAYKEMVEIAYQNKREEVFQNDILPILNYYYKVKTESTNKSDMVVHNNNVQALFTILRKKYARPNSRS